MDKLRIGVIGAGFFACLAHLPRLRASGEVAVSAVCRRDRQALHQVADHFGVPGRFTDYRQMLDEAPLDAVVVSSPHALHAEHTRAALTRGLHVLSDKPLAVEAREAEKLRALAASRGLTLLVAAAPPYAGWQRYLGQRIAAGDLGTIHLVQNAGLQNVGGLFGHGAAPTNYPFPVLVPPTDFRAHSESGGGGYFQDVGSHAVAGILVTTGLRPVEVAAAFDEPELDVRPSVTIRFAGGAVAVITQIADAWPEDDTYHTFNNALYVGSKALCSWDSRTNGLLFQAVGGPAEEVPAEALPPNSSPVQNFIGVLREREEPLYPIATAVETVRVVEAAYRSAAERKPIALDTAAA